MNNIEIQYHTLDRLLICIFQSGAQMIRDIFIVLNRFSIVV